MPELSRRTVYNTKRQLIWLGVLAEVEDLTGEGTARYDTNIYPHRHLFCLSCHVILAIGMTAAELDLR